MAALTPSLSLRIGTLLLVAMMQSMPAQAERRLALVIGNDDYAQLPDLINAGRDATALARKLETFGFEVQLRRDTNRRELFRSLAKFEGRLAQGGTGLLFYAGHGIQSDNENYLIPVDAEVEVEADLRSEGIRLSTFMDAMASAGNALNIVILDACRDNPLPRRTRSASRGLTVANIPSGANGTVIVYAAGEGQVAQDGPPDGHGVFTDELLKTLDQPNLTLTQVVRQVTERVLARTDNRQRPWSLASLQGDFVFNYRQEPLTGDTLPGEPDGSQVNRMKVASEIWKTVKESNDPEMIRRFRDQFHDTPYAMAADTMLESFERQPSIEPARPSTSLARENQRPVGIQKYFQPNPSEKENCTIWDDPDYAAFQSQFFSGGDSPDRLKNSRCN